MGPRELFLLLFLSSLLPRRCVGPRGLELSLWGPLELGLRSQHPLLSLQLGFHQCLMGWLANGSAAHPVVFPAADCGGGQVGVVSLGARKNRSESWDAYCYREQGAAHPPLVPEPSCPYTLAWPLPTDPAPPFPQMWPAGAAMALWVMGQACAMASCSMSWLPQPTSPPSMGCAGAQP